MVFTTITKKNENNLRKVHSAIHESMVNKEYSEVNNEDEQRSQLLLSQYTVCFLL